MSIAGSIYGVVLNDREELDRLMPQFNEPPYAAPPRAPVVYMKPRSAIARRAVRHPATALVCASTLALLIARDVSARSPTDAIDCVGAVALALDLSLPQTSHYRPAVAHRNADGFLALGEWRAPFYPIEIVTRIDGRDVHRWRLERLLRAPAHLIADLSQFMTLQAGDVLLVGLPGDAPTAGRGQALQVLADGLAPLDIAIAGAEA